MCLASQAHHSQPRWNRHLNLARYRRDFFRRTSLLVKISWHNKWHASAQTWVWRCLSELVQSSVVLGQVAIFEGVTLTPIQGISDIWGVVLSFSGNQGAVKWFLLYFSKAWLIPTDLKRETICSTLHCPIEDTSTIWQDRICAWCFLLHPGWSLERPAFLQVKDNKHTVLNRTTCLQFCLSVRDTDFWALLVNILFVTF